MISLYQHTIKTYSLAHFSLPNSKTKGLNMRVGIEEASGGNKSAIIDSPLPHISSGPKKTILTVAVYDVATVILNPKSLYVFGDNDIKKGKLGQAIIRDCSNAMGVPTKRLPSRSSEAYYSDSDLEENKRKIDIAFDNIIKTLNNPLNGYDSLVLPLGGLGTGLAKLDSKAPLTFEHLQKRLEELKRMY